MSDSNANPLPRRRWLAWRPGEPITADSAGTEPTKPSEPGFDGFDGSPSAQSAEIEAPLSEPQGLYASAPRRLKFITSAVDSSTATERVMSWAEWKAAALNQLFLEFGSTGQPGRITADTIRHGERAWMTSWKNRDAKSQNSLRPE
jgi:hypothetical protein